MRDRVHRYRAEAAGEEGALGGGEDRSGLADQLLTPADRMRHAHWSTLVSGFAGG